MFEVENKKTGQICTAYNIHGTYFLFYNFDEDHWFYDDIDDYKPLVSHEN